MKIISWNVNGIRSACRQGFLAWLKKSGADVVCLQEIKAQEPTFPRPEIEAAGYHVYANCAAKKGYSGVAVLTKQKPLAVTTTLGPRRFDVEGRMLQLEYPTFILFALYLPHGGRQKENLAYKLEVYEKLFRRLKVLTKKPVILAGDFNIAHAELDLARPKSNKKNIMFTPAERAQLDRLVALGFTDTFRALHKEGGNYTWWPYMANARERNIGWRIDYVYARNTTEMLRAGILKSVRGSDHCPVYVEFDYC